MTAQGCTSNGGHWGPLGLPVFAHPLRCWLYLSFLLKLNSEIFSKSSAAGCLEASLRRAPVLAVGVAVFFTPLSGRLCSLSEIASACRRHTQNVCVFEHRLELLEGHRPAKSLSRKGAAHLRQEGAADCSLVAREGPVCPSRSLQQLRGASCTRCCCSLLPAAPRGMTRGITHAAACSCMWSVCALRRS